MENEAGTQDYRFAAVYDHGPLHWTLSLLISFSNI